MTKLERLLSNRYYTAFIQELNLFLDHTYEGSAYNFAGECDISPGHLSGIRRLKVAPHVDTLQILAEKSGITADLDLIYGTKADRPEEAKSSEPPPNVIELDHARLIRKFRNKALAREINRKLVEIERHNPTALQKISDMLDGMVLMAVAEPQARYGEDRRKGERRIEDHPDRIPPSGDRRSGRDRRKAAGK